MGIPEHQFLVSIYKDHTAVVNTLWGIFQAVSLALAGFVFSQEHVRYNWFLLLVLSVAFVCFAYGNRRAIDRSQRIICAASAQLAEEAKQAPPWVAPVLAAHEAMAADDQRRGHRVLTMGVIVVSWMPWVAWVGMRFLEALLAE